MVANGSRLRLLISEENAVLRYALTTYFSGQANIEVVGQATQSDETLALCQQLFPDVILINSSLSPMNILAFIGRLCDESPNTRIVVFTSSLDETPPRHYLEAGASAVANQGIFASDLLNVIRKAHKRH